MLILLSAYLLSVFLSLYLACLTHKYHNLIYYNKYKKYINSAPSFLLCISIIPIFNIVVTFTIFIIEYCTYKNFNLDKISLRFFDYWSGIKKLKDFEKVRKL